MTVLPDRNLALELVRVTEAAALASARLVGMGDKIAADQAAVDAMRHVLETVPISARIASTAAPSPPFLSPRPTQRPAAMAPASVTRTSSSARLRSGAGRLARNVLARLVGLGCPSGSGRDT